MAARGLYMVNQMTKNTKLKSEIPKFVLKSRVTTNM